MKDKRLDALLETLTRGKKANLFCSFYNPDHTGKYCEMAKKEYGWDFHTDCQSDIRKCEREE